CRYNERPDTDTSSWKQHALQDLGMQRRLAALLPPPKPPPTTPSTSTDEDMDVENWTIIPPAAAGDAVPEIAESNDRIRPRLLLKDALHFKSDPATTQAGFRRIGSPAYHIDYASNTIIAASIVTRPTANNASSGAWLKDRQIMFYSLPDLSHPIAVCGSEYWTEPAEDGKNWYFPHPNVDELQVMQVAEVRHFPDTIVNGAMRVLLVLAFGRGYDSEDVLEAQILDIWLI
ncbi:hypothetical protein BGZ65_010783, partial [Modicella reniformis]